MGKVVDAEEFLGRAGKMAVGSGQPARALKISLNLVDTLQKRGDFGLG